MVNIKGRFSGRLTDQSSVRVAKRAQVFRTLHRVIFDIEPQNAAKDQLNRSACPFVCVW